MNDYQTLSALDVEAAQKRAALAPLLEGIDSLPTDEAKAERAAAIKHANLALKAIADQRENLVQRLLRAPAPGSRQVYPDARDSGPSSGAKAARAAFPDLTEAVLRSVESAQAATGMKTFIADGSAYVDIPVGGPVADPYRMTFVEGLLPVEDAPGGQFQYLRQTVRDNNAAVVATGAEKPVSTYTLVNVEDTTDVIAHVSEPLPKFFFDDSPKLRTFITNEMGHGVRIATDTEIITDLLATSGILTEGDIGAVWETARRALTRLQERDIAPTAFVMAPHDWEQVEGELLTTFAANAGATVPTDAFKRSLFGIPVVISNAVPIHTVILGDFETSAALYATGGIAVEWSDGAGFTKNEITWRAERRAKLAVLRPFAFCVIVASGTGS